MTHRLLVIDDEESIRFTFREFLADEGYQVDLASDLDGALRAVDKGGYDAVFLDILLGRDSGIEVLRRCRAANNNCPVVMVTGAPDISTAAEAVRLGAFDYITKPVNQQELLRLARLAVERKGLADQQETFRLRMKAVFQSVLEGILVFDESLNLVEANESARKMLAFESGMIGKSIAELSRSSGGKVFGALADVIGSRCEGELYSFETVNCVGEKLTLGLSMAPLTSQAGQEIGVVLVMRDENRRTSTIEQ
jgi:PAS domain S-box-containing protein